MDPVLSLIVRCGLALLLATAAADKLRHVREFHGIVLDYRLLPARRALAFAHLLPWLELALAAMVLAGVAAGLVGTAALLAGYAAAMGINLARGRRTIDCGCGGPPQQLSAWLLARNGLLAMAALLAVSPAGDRAIGALDAFTVMAGTVAAAALYVAAHQVLAARTRYKTLFSTHD
jgi:hypothetical protein